MNLRKPRNPVWANRAIALWIGVVAYSAMAQADVASTESVAPWWSDQAAIWVGAIGGSVLGMFGAVAGTCGGIIGTLSGQGKARQTVERLMSLMIAAQCALAALGVVALIAGIVAVTGGQPYGVYYPLLLGGGICMIVFGSGVLVGRNLRPVIRKRYDEAELRKMQSLDAGS